MVEVVRDTAHPWSGTPGWDLMKISARTGAGLVALVQSGKDKFWRLLWTSGTEALMYKPSGATADWTDKDEWVGRDREASRALARVGQAVYTDFSGAVTRHEIVEIQEKATCGCGILVRVTPAVPKSGGWWLDAGWFRALDFAAPTP